MPVHLSGNVIIRPFYYTFKQNQAALFHGCRKIYGFDNTLIFKSSATHKLEEEQTKKLFCRFPNLKNVSIYDNFDIFSEFDDDLCKDILSSCPKLDNFEVDTDAEKFTNLIYNVRLLLTSIDFQCIADTIDNIQLQFPRLQDIITNHYRLQDALPMIEKFPSLKSVSFRQTYRRERETTDLFKWKNNQRTKGTFKYTCGYH